MRRSTKQGLGCEPGGTWECLERKNREGRSCSIVRAGLQRNGRDAGDKPVWGGDRSYSLSMKSFWRHYGIPMRRELAAKVKDSGEAWSNDQSHPNGRHSPDEQKVPGERKQPRSGSARILKFVGRAKGTERRVPRCGDVGEAT